MNGENFDYIKTFPPLGHPEHHFNKYPNHPWLKTKDDVMKWLCFYDQNYSYSDNKYVIHDDLTVTKNGDFYFKNTNNKKDKYIKVQFRGALEFIASVGLRSLIGTPYNCNFMGVNNNKIKDFYGMSKNITYISIAGNELKNFKGMPELREGGIIDVSYNSIESWEGFTNFNRVIFLFKDIEKAGMEKVKGLMQNLPNSVNSMWSEFQLRKDEHPFGNLVEPAGKDGMYWFMVENIRNWQIEQRLKKVNDKIDDELVDFRNNERKRRKI